MSLHASPRASDKRITVSDMSAINKQQNAFIYNTKSGAFGKKNTSVQFRMYLEQYINTILQNKQIFGPLLDPTK